MSGADLQLRDARVSEAHALISLRGQKLLMLRLRGPLFVAGKVVSQVDLKPGVQIALAHGLELVIESVMLPETVLALVVDGGEPSPLTRGTYSVMVDPEFTVSARYHPHAIAWIWCDEQGYFIETDGEVEPLSAGQRLHLGGVWVEVVSTSAGGTIATAVSWEQPLRIVAQYDAVHIHREGHAVVHLGGLPARMLSELVAVGAPIQWSAVAEEIWGTDVPRHRLRLRWDKNLRTLKKKLQATGIQRPLVTSFGHGMVALSLREGDVAVDES